MIFQDADLDQWEERLLHFPRLLPSPRLFLAARGSVCTFMGRVKTMGMKAHAGNNHLFLFFLPCRDHPQPLPGLGAAAPSPPGTPVCVSLPYFIFGSRNLTLATTFFSFFPSLGSAVKPARMNTHSSIPPLWHGLKQLPLPGWELITRLGINYLD